MRTKLRSKFTLLLIVCAALIAVPGAAALAQDTGTSPAPTIQSDKADYAPVISSRSLAQAGSPASRCASS